MSNNDSKIKDLLTQIEVKKNALGTKPKASWRTNGVVKLGSDVVNINTINSLSKAVSITSRLILEMRAYSEACKELGVVETENEELDILKDYLEDIKLRVKIVQWDEEKKKLTELENKLKDLRSVDAKTEDALADISKTLGI